MGPYLSPGVYVEEVPSAVRPIAGVGTSTAGFIGIVPDTVAMPLKPDSTTDRYPVAASAKAVRVTNWEEFKNNFGDFQDVNKVLAHAVYGFFNNGGGACFVARVTDAKDYEAALDEFRKEDEIAIVAIPGVTNMAIQEKILIHCESMKDRFAILDGVQKPASLSKADISGGLRNAIDGYGAIYFPWIKVQDPVSNTEIPVPPSGHIAGIYARSDAERGVHKAPANEVIRGALNVEHKLSREMQDPLNQSSINVIRAFNGNMTIWGARTWADTGVDPEWKYISTRRLFNFLRESIEEGTRWVVFEPNDKSLWQKIRRNISGFLTTVWRDGALFGATAEEAFYVKCDETINTEDVRNLGQVITEIGVKIVNPAEFVVFRISQWTGTPA
ncbi:phage tail sheath subtilisin-like domain-containing protein [bacterium]|nr:phage tail sheath subtilisin-like domain-containing protein [bacterium]